MKAHHMVVHVKGRPPIEVDGLEWEANRGSILFAVEVYDDHDQYLGVELFKNHSMTPGDVFIMPDEVSCEDAPPCG